MRSYFTFFHLISLEVPRILPKECCFSAGGLAPGSERGQSFSAGEGRCIPSFKSPGKLLAKPCRLSANVRPLKARPEPFPIIFLGGAMGRARPPRVSSFPQADDRIRCPKPALRVLHNPARGRPFQGLAESCLSLSWGCLSARRLTKILCLVAPPKAEPDHRPVYHGSPLEPF